MENMIRSRQNVIGQNMKPVSLLGTSFLTQDCIEWCFDLSTQPSRKGKEEKL